MLAALVALGTLLGPCPGCGSGSGGDADALPEPSGPPWLNDAKPQDDSRLVEPPDSGGEDAGMDVPASMPDTGPPNKPPSFEAIPPVSLDMGTHTTVDLSQYVWDDDDPAEDLVLSWSAQHVALQDNPGHQLLVVAPTTWFGSEVIAITATDTEGLTSKTGFKVIVKEVVPPEPVVPPECDDTLFACKPDKAASQVLLSGTFNNWASTPETATVMKDDDKDGTWTVSLPLAAGTYQYKFIVDGEWKTDPANPDKVPDNYGGYNSVLTVAECPADR